LQQLQRGGLGRETGKENEENGGPAPAEEDDGLSIAFASME
jgi:hypothetical protein